MSKGSLQKKGKKKTDIKSYLTVSSERRILRSNAMADVSESNVELEVVGTGEDTIKTPDQQFYLDAISQLEERHLNVMTKMEERHLESLNKMEGRLANQFTELQTGIANNNSVITEVKSNVERADTNVDRIGTSVQSFTDELKNLTTGQKRLEVGHAKLENRITVIEEKQAITENENRELAKNIEFHDEEIKTLKNELAEFKTLKTEVEQLKKENAQFKIENEAREQHSRKYNLWFYGLEEPEEEAKVWDTVKNFCTNILKLGDAEIVKIPIKNAHRVGAPKVGSQKVKNRPIIVVFSHWDDRQFVLKAAGPMYSINQKNNTNFAVKTDLAPLARKKRKQFIGAAIKMKAETKLLVRTCNNEKGHVWLESKKNVKDEWNKVKEKDIKPRWLDDTPDEETSLAT